MAKDASLGEEVAGVERLAGVGDDQRLAVGAVRLDLDLAGGGGEAVDGGAEELRQATEAVAVLDELAGAVVALA